jgi:outer membrane protein W
MKKARLFVALMILVSGLSLAQPKRFELSLFGGVSPVFAYGSSDDYVAGSNDFPVTPAHTPANFGAAFTYYLGARLGVELRGEYTLAVPMTLSDPSDQDTVSIKSGEHLAASLNLLWELSGSRIRPYVVLGGGADKLSDSTVTALSQNGYDVTFAPQDKTLNFFANAGGGLRYMVSPSLGFDIDLRYRLLFGDPDTTHGLIVGAGVFWKF